DDGGGDSGDTGWHRISLYLLYGYMHLLHPPLITSRPRAYLNSTGYRVSRCHPLSPLSPGPLDTAPSARSISIEDDLRFWNSTNATPTRRRNSTHRPENGAQGAAERAGNPSDLAPRALARDGLGDGPRRRPSAAPEGGLAVVGRGWRIYLVCGQCGAW